MTRAHSFFYVKKKWDQWLNMKTSTEVTIVLAGSRIFGVKEEDLSAVEGQTLPLVRMLQNLKTNKTQTKKRVGGGLNLKQTKADLIR